jgi:hypothetical protein
LPALETEAPAPAPAKPDDPEKGANDFVEKTRKEAAFAVESLRKEAESLRKRLQKVEAALQRWENLLEALQSNPGALDRGQAAVLEPIAPGSGDTVAQPGTIRSVPGVPIAPSEPTDPAVPRPQR